MPSKKTAVSPRSESHASPKGHKPSEGEKKRYESRFDFSKYPTDKTADNHMKKRLTSSEFREMLRTISQDFENTLEVYKYVLTSGTKYRNWDKNIAKQYFAKCQKRLMLTLEYYKYRPPTTRVAASGKQQLSQVFYVFQNFKDWINEVNMGTGLAKLLIAKKTNPKDNDKELFDVAGFIRDANTKLETETSVKEINRLLNFHTPEQVSGFMDGKYLFTMDGENVSSEDKHFLRILEIHNAYRESKGKKQLSVNKALAMVVPQRSEIEHDGKKFNVQEVLNVEITTNDEEKHHSAAIVSAMSGIFMTLMAKANKIQETAQGYTKYVHYEILERYFGGKDENYPAGRGVGFYLSNKDQTANLITNLPKKKRFDDNGKPTEGTRNAVKALLNESDSKDSAAYTNIINRMSEAEEKNFTAMTYVANGGRKTVDGKKPPYIKKGKEDSPYGLINYASTQFAYYNRIPEQFLSKASRKAAEEGKELTEKVGAVQKYFSEINNVYSHYAKASQAELRKEERAKEKSRKSPGKKTKTKTEVINLAASPKITGASPAPSPKVSPKKSPGSKGSIGKGRKPASSGE